MDCIIISSVLSNFAYKGDLKASREETQAALAHLNDLDNARGVVWKYGELEKEHIRYEKRTGRVVSRDSYKFPVVFMETFDVPATFEGTSLNHDLPPTPVASIREYASPANVRPDEVKVAVPSHPAHAEHDFASSAAGYAMPAVPSHPAQAQHRFSSSAAGYSMSPVPLHPAHAEHGSAPSATGYSMPYPPSQAYQANSSPYTPTSPVQSSAPPSSPVESFAELEDQKPAPPPYSGP
ncbi:hypothetical protein HDU85_006437 [Gaertneriomyces sp. JEL0708]|nr:hypothetical protein HDU85_006437 [Gaertneriomyces sp. JEL0708]